MPKPDETVTYVPSLLIGCGYSIRGGIHHLSASIHESVIRIYDSGVDLLSPHSQTLLQCMLGDIILSICFLHLFLLVSISVA